MGFQTKTKPPENGNVGNYWEYANGKKLRDAIRRDTKAALSKLNIFGIIQIVIAVFTVGFGAAIIGIAASNVGFPVFNVTPLLTGIAQLAAGILAFLAARIGLQKKDPDLKVNRMIRAHFGLCVIAVFIGLVALVTSFMAVTVCTGSTFETYIYYTEAGKRNTHDLLQYCTPNKDAKMVLSFVNGVACMLVFMWNCYGFCIYCSYGPVFGLGWRGGL